MAWCVGGWPRLLVRLCSVGRAVKKPEGNWNDKKPDIGERLAVRLSPHSGWSETLGGLPNLTASDFAAAVGMVSNTTHRLMLGARYGGWTTDRDQLREITLRHSWTRWLEKKRPGNMSAKLNVTLVDMALGEWCCRPDERAAISEAYRARELKVGYRRYKQDLHEHYGELIAWLDMETSNALGDAAKTLKRPI